MKRKFQLKFYEKIIILLLVLIATLLIFSYIYNPIIIEGNNTNAKVYKEGDNGSKEHKKSVEKDNSKRDEVKRGTKKAFKSHAKMVGEKK